jgi:hypothetical protein
MSPTTYLLACLCVMVLAVAIDAVGDGRRRARLRRLAQRAGMHFVAGDRFNLAPRVAAAFPVVGAARPKVADVLYGRRDDRYYYVFRFDYTVGGIARPQRRRAVVGMSEPRHRRDARDATAATPADNGAALTVADVSLPLIDQYELMIERAVPKPTPAAEARMAEITMITDARRPG